MRALLGAIIIIVTSACAADSTDSDESSVVRDSAGIQIVESSVPLWNEQTRWRIPDQPSLAIGGGISGDSAREFGYIGAVHRLSGGTIAVLDVWAPSITFFDSAGALLGVHAKQGSGPGELSRAPGAVRSAFVCEDTVFVFADRRMAGYTAPGVYVRTLTPERPTRVFGCARNRFVGWLPHGAPRTEAGIRTDSAQFAWFDTNGAVLSVIDTLPDSDRQWSIGPEGAGYMQLPFGRKLALAVHDTLLASAFGHAFEIELHGDSGAASRIVRVLGLERSVGAAEIEQFRAFVFNEWGGNDQERRDLAASVEEAVGRPLPAVGELRFDRAGNLWARVYDHVDAVAFFDYSSFIRTRKRAVVDASRIWLVLRPDGRLLGEVSLPTNFTVHEIGDDWILGAWRDELDIQSVRVYPLIKPAP